MCGTYKPCKGAKRKTVGLETEQQQIEKCLGNNGDWPPLSQYIVAPHQSHRPLQDVTADNRCFTERRKKTVRFDQHDGRQGSQDSHRDSGIDTSSTFTSSEDSTRGDLPKVWHQANTCKIILKSLNYQLVYPSSVSVVLGHKIAINNQNKSIYNLCIFV